MTRSPAPAAVHVRRAAPSDLDDLVELERTAFDSDRLSRAQYRRHLDSDSARVLVARTDRPCLLGAAVLFFRKGSAIARLYSLASASDARGQGIGAKLMAAAEDAARQHGCRCMRLEVRSDNASAIRFYERLGYHRCGRREDFYEDGSDAWLYRKPLA